MRFFHTSIIAIFLLTATSTHADYTAIVSPGSVVATNFQGWGTSLAWWANVIGSYPNRTNYIDLAFTTLKFNIARYNIGGGENPSSPVPGQGYRTIMQGFEPTNGIWNWNADTNQRWVLQQAAARGVNLVDAFANSPPWWMCVNSNCVGNASATNNLLVNCETNFAVYLATVVSNLTVLDGDHFDYLTPMNEPNGSKWYSGSPGQEGCNINPAQQSDMVSNLYVQLQKTAPSVGIDAAEDVDPEQTYLDLNSYSSTSLGDVSLFTTHTYSFTGAANLKSKASSQNKALWVSEYGDNDGSGMKMARRIHDDITQMGLRAWVYWQLVDSAGGWGLLLNSLLATTNSSYTPNYTINEKFYVMGQFSEFIRPGCTIISVNDTNTLAAWNPTNSTLVLVTINTNTSSLNITYNLNSFSSLSWHVNATRTSPTENIVSVPPPTVTANQFTYAIPAQSVTTFVLTTNIFVPVFVSQLPQPYASPMKLYAGQAPTFSVSATGTLPIHYQWMSNGVPIAGVTGTNYTFPKNIPSGSQASFDCVATNLFGSATSMVWSVSVIPAPIASYPTTVLALNPIGYWRLNEAEQGGGDNGLIAEDCVGGNNGIYTNVLLGQPGYSAVTEPSATSALFGYVATHDSCAYSIGGPDFSLPNGSSAEFTVMAWVNSAGANGLNTPTVAAKGLYFQEEYALDAGAAGSYRFSVRNAAGTAYNASSAISLTNTAQWYHLAGVCDEANSRVSLYINGALVASAAIPAASGITNSSQTPMTIGSRASTSTSGFNQQFPGYINDVTIYNYALSSAQIQNVYASGISLPPVGLTLTSTNGNGVLNWNYGMLQSATNVAGPYLDLTNVTQPYAVPSTNAQQFFRVREN